jgi:hypothetical protein
MVLGIVILFLFAISIGLSGRVLFAIKDGQIVKHVRFLKYVNVIHLIAVGLWLLTLPLSDVFMWGKGEAILFFFIYALFGVTALISNIVVLVGQYISKNNSGE